MKKRRYYIVGIIAVILCAAALIIGGLTAKYVHKINLSGSVTFSSGLADVLKLTEHEAVLQPDGSYKLSSEEVTKNEYKVMPGVDIPKDPRITLAGKSSVRAYMYIEAVDNSPETVTYTVTSDWKLLYGVVGANGGSVYVYAKDGEAAVLDKNGETQVIDIIDGNKLTVSENYDGEGFEIKFYGYMAQIADGKNAAEVFSETFGAQSTGGN